MNIFVDEISPGDPDGSNVSIKVSMNTLKDEELGYTSHINIRLIIDKKEVIGLSLQQIHDVAIDRAFQTLKRFSDERPSADVRSGF